MVFCAAAGGAHAAEWFATGEIRQEVEYDDNIGLNLSSDDAVSDVGFTSTILANAGARTPNLNILLDTRFTFTVFPNEDQLKLQRSVHCPGNRLPVWPERLGGAG